MESVLDAAWFEKIKNDLRSESKNIRKNCLDELRKCLHPSDCKFESVVDKADIVKTIITIFADKTEACRERAVQLAIDCVKEWDLPEDDIMFRLLPSIHKRLVSGAETEPAEEVRLGLVRLVKVIVSRYEAKLSPHLKDVVDMLIRCICDEYPEVKKESCECASDLAEKVPEFRLHSEDIISAILKVLKHKHSKIRISAVNSLRNVVQFGHPGAVELVYGALGECLLEQNAQIRLAVLKVGAFWFIKLRDRYSYFRYLLPLVLIELTDDSEMNRKEAEMLWHEIGLQYLRENENDLKEKEELLPKELPQYPTNVERPNLGCRTIVQIEMMKIIPTIIHELEDWKSEVRIKSSELLKTIILHGEKRIVSFLDIALPVMCKACTDEERVVCKNVVESAEIMGYFVPTDLFWKVLIPRMRENHSAGQYVILAALLKHNSKSTVADRLEEIITDLADSELRETRDERCQNSLLEIVSKLFVCMEKSNFDDERLYDLYLILASVMALGVDDETRKRASALVEKLAALSSNSSVSHLNALCLPKVFSRLLVSSSMWESYSTDFNILLALLANYAEDVFQYVAAESICLMETTLDHKADKEVTFRTLKVFGKLLENDEIDLKNNAEFVEKIILGPLKAQLVWRAGKVLEVVRCAAVGIVLLFVQKSPALSRDFIRNVHPLVLSLCEDGYAETRLYALQILPLIGRTETGTIETDIFVKSLSVATERLNDKNNAVRLNAVKSTKNLLLEAPDMTAYKDESRTAVVNGCRMILLHADDEDQRIRGAIADILTSERIATNMKSIVSADDVKRFVKKCRNSDVSDLLEKYLNI